MNKETFNEIGRCICDFWPSAARDMASDAYAQWRENSPLINYQYRILLNKWDAQGIRDLRGALADYIYGDVDHAYPCIFDNLCHYPEEQLLEFCILESKENTYEDIYTKVCKMYLEIHGGK